MAVWRCRVCEAVNHGGRRCVSCGTQVPVGEPVRAAVRTRLPSADPPARSAPPPVPPMPRRRDLREMPTLEDLLFADPDDLYEVADESSDGRLRIAPIPGGCLVGPSMRPRRRGIWF